MPRRSEVAETKIGNLCFDFQVAPLLITFCSLTADLLLVVLSCLWSACHLGVVQGEADDASGEARVLTGLTHVGLGDGNDLVVIRDEGHAEWKALGWRETNKKLHLFASNMQEFLLLTTSGVCGSDGGSDSSENVSADPLGCHVGRLSLGDAASKLNVGDLEQREASL